MICEAFILLVDSMLNHLQTGAIVNQLILVYKVLFI